MVYLPTFTIFYHENQPNVGIPYNPYMDPVGKWLRLQRQTTFPTISHLDRFFSKSTVTPHSWTASNDSGWKSGHQTNKNQNCTLPKLNIAPEKWWLEDDPLLLGWYIFRAKQLNFHGVTVGSETTSESNYRSKLYHPPPKFQSETYTLCLNPSPSRWFACGCSRVKHQFPNIPDKWSTYTKQSHDFFIPGKKKQTVITTKKKVFHPWKTNTSNE